MKYSLVTIVIFLISINLSNAQRLPWAYTLYPYGREFNDSFTARNQDTGSGALHLPFNITFMGHKLNKVWVHHAGYIAFQDDVKFSIYDDWPHPNWPQVDDPIFLAPFYCRIELNNDIYLTGELQTDFYKDDNYGRVMYRWVQRDGFDIPKNKNLTSAELARKQANEMLNMAQDNIRDSISGVENFVAEYALVATWGNVTFLGINQQNLELRPRNSFQAVIVTDSIGNYTFVIFNYEKIEWAASTEFGGNSLTGLSTTRGAKIGFNRGNGTEFFKVLPFSDNPNEILKLDQESNVNHRGRFIYRVDEWIQPAGCDNEFSNGTLYIWPRFGNMLGGQEVNITGPCFGYHPDPTSDYFVPYGRTFCRWGDEQDSIVTMAEVITMLRARCVMPQMWYNGRINLWISIDNGITYDWRTEFTIVDPIRYQPKVELVSIDDWMKPVPNSKSLAIKWNRDDLGWSRNETVEVQLFGYYEDEVPHWDFLQPLGERILNTGFYEFVVEKNWAVEMNRARQYKVGAVAVTLMSGGTEDPKRIWSQIQPLGWWRHEQMDILYDREKILFGSSRGRNWVEDQCRWWHEYERWDRFWMYDLERCPCTINFATADMGRWIPDPECNMNRDQTDPTNCLLHKGALHCVVNYKPTVSGGGSRCCYNYDGNLMYTNDTKSGSTSDRYHLFGIPPYNARGHVPALSHYLYDMVPFYLCCEWSDLCDSYLYLRETADCKGYRYPKSAAIYGDPHVKTFDGQEYTFNARGEYRLLLSTRNGFILQGRFERPPNASCGQINATRLTAIVVEEKYSDRIEVRARIHPSQTWRFKCDLFINGIQWYINSTEEKLQFFNNVSIMSPYNDMYMSNLTIIFNTTGAGVRVSCEYGMLNVHVSAPPVMYYETEGLLGYWNDNSTDDFRTQAGFIVPHDSSPQNISKYFAQPWRIEYKKDSLFTYSGSYDFNKFHDQKEYIHSWMQFVPWYTWTDSNFKFPTRVNFSESQMLAVCDGDEQCLYDSKAMGSLEIGEETKKAHRYYKFLHEAMKPVNSCGIYLLKGGVRKTNTGNYLAGSKMTVSCGRGYTFYGYSEYICHPNGTWLPANGIPLHKFKNWPFCEHRHITSLKYTSLGFGILYAALVVTTLVFYIIKRKKPSQSHERDIKASGENGNFDGKSFLNKSQVAVSNPELQKLGPNEEEDEMMQRDDVFNSNLNLFNTKQIDEVISEEIRSDSSGGESFKAKIKRKKLLHKPLTSNVQTSESLENYKKIQAFGTMDSEML